MHGDTPLPSVRVDAKAKAIGPWNEKQTNIDGEHATVPLTVCKQRTFFLVENFVKVQLRHRFAVTQMNSHSKTFRTHRCSPQSRHRWIGSEDLLVGIPGMSPLPSRRVHMVVKCDLMEKYNYIYIYSYIV